ncbi:MAG: phosphopyruvate hydratase [Candidatus Pacebacteria bacterium]|nr:phosphopyruvate hydratase [Candidatus Paceibacterota bacterium]
MKINSVSARAILDTRGRPTIETTLASETDGHVVSACASVPSGKSTGSHETIELRDADGSVAGALANITGEIARALKDHDFASADEVDSLLIALDGTRDKSRLGGNALLSVSIAAQRLFAEAAGIPLWRAIARRAGTTPAAPRLYINMMNGGAHADFKLPFQEYLLVVEGAPSTAFPVAHEAFIKLGERLGDVSMGDEGGYAPSFDTLEKPFELLAELVREFPGTSIALDAAASGLFKNGTYELLDKSYSAEELTVLYANITANYPLHSIEDPFDEESADDFTRLTAALGEKVLIIGDDLTVTDPSRISEAAGRKEINAVLIKPNQIGTVREALQAVQATYTEGFAAIASHRSGETSDTFIADFAYGVGAHGIKAGGLAQSERLAKYDRLLAIEQEAKVG